jgi:hypothetical protein
MLAVYVARQFLLHCPLRKIKGENMNIDDKIAHAKNLIEKREEIDAELSALFGISSKLKKSIRCSRCGEEGHNAKTCASPQPLTGEE